MSKLKALRGLFKRGFDKFGEASANVIFETKVPSRVKERVQREVDLITRPGRAHGYEEPVGKPHRTRAEGQAVYEKSLGVPGFKTKKHHEFLKRQKSNWIKTGIGLTAGALGTAYYLTRTDSKTEKVKKTTRANEFKAIRTRREAEFKPVPWTPEYAKDVFLYGASPNGKRSKDPTESAFKKKHKHSPYSTFESVIESSFRRSRL